MLRIRKNEIIKYVNQNAKVVYNWISPSDANMFTEFNRSTNRYEVFGIVRGLNTLKIC